MVYHMDMCPPAVRSGFPRLQSTTTNNQMKLKLLLAAASLAFILQASAALMGINNLTVGTGDTLYADKDNVTMSQGIVTIGYFPDGVNPTDIPSLLANLGSFTVIDNQTAGTHYMFAGFGMVVPGYAATQFPKQVPGGPVTGDNPLLGRNIYSIVSDAASLAAATADNQFAMFSMGVFLDDSPSEKTYIANPAGTTPIIGSFGRTFVEGEIYNTLKMDVFAGPAALAWDHDADGTASDGAGTWLGANQWWNGTAGTTWDNDSPVNAIIGSGGTGGTITLGAVTAGSVLIDNFTGTYTLSGTGLTQSGGLTIGTTAGNVTLSTPVGGSGALVKNNSGTLTLSAANSFSGGITVNAGTLVASNDVFLGAAGGGLTFNGTCSFGNNGNWPIDAGRTITISEGANVTFLSSGNQIRSPVAGSGTLTVARSTAGNASLQMNNTANTFTGAMNLDDKADNGTSNYFFNSLGDGPGAGTIRLGYGGQGAGFLLNSSAIAPLVLNHRQLDIGGTRSSIVNIIGDPAKSFITLTINTDLLFTGAGSRTLSLDGPNAGDNTIAGKIPDGPTGTVISLEKNGTGKWVLSGANTYTGNTTVNSGTLVLASTGQLKFAVTDSASTRLTRNGGSVTLNGSFVIDTSATTNAAAGPWTLVSGSNVTYGETFSVAGFTDAGDGSWSRQIGSQTWAFDQATGQLALSAASGYAGWAATHAPNGSADGDHDGDGVPNGVEYVLGGSKDRNDTGKLPAPSIDGDDMVFTFVRDQASIDGSTTVQIETSTDLATWDSAPSPYAVPDGAASNNPGVSVEKDSPGAGKDTVTLRIPRAPDASKFARIKVTVP